MPYRIIVSVMPTSVRMRTQHRCLRSVQPIAMHPTYELCAIAHRRTARSTVPIAVSLIASSVARRPGACPRPTPAKHRAKCMSKAARCFCSPCIQARGHLGRHNGSLPRRSTAWALVGDLRGAPRQRRNSEACSGRSAALRRLLTTSPTSRALRVQAAALHAPARPARGGEPRARAPPARARSGCAARGPPRTRKPPRGARPRGGHSASLYTVRTCTDALVSSRPYYGACILMLFALVDVPSDGTDGVPWYVCSCSLCSFAARSFVPVSGRRRARRGAARWRCRGTRRATRAAGAARARAGAEHGGAALARRAGRGPLGTAGTPIPAPPAAMGRRERLAQMLEVENAKEKVGGRCAVLALRGGRVENHIRARMAREGERARGKGVWGVGGARGEQRVCRRPRPRKPESARAFEMGPWITPEMLGAPRHTLDACQHRSCDPAARMHSHVCMYPARCTFPSPLALQVVRKNATPLLRSLLLDLPERVGPESCGGAGGGASTEALKRRRSARSVPRARRPVRQAAAAVAKPRVPAAAPTLASSGRCTGPAARRQRRHAHRRCRVCNNNWGSSRSLRLRRSSSGKWRDRLRVSRSASNAVFLTSSARARAGA